MNRYPIAEDDGGWKKIPRSNDFPSLLSCYGKTDTLLFALKVSLKRSHNLLDPLVYINFICRRFTVSDF